MDEVYMGKKKPQAGLEDLFAHLGNQYDGTEPASGVHAHKIAVYEAGGPRPEAQVLLDAPRHFSVQDVNRLSDCFIALRTSLDLWAGMSSMTGCSMSVAGASVIDHGEGKVPVLRYNLTVTTDRGSYTVEGTNKRVLVSCPEGDTLSAYVDDHESMWLVYSRLAGGS